jgi:hypothetical protein
MNHGVEIDWPERTPVACWNCSFAFDTPPLALPYRYDERANRFHTRGVFCTYGCMKRYNMTHTRSSSHVYRTSYLISALYRKLEGRLGDGVAAAPPVMRLQRFGGDLTIDAYRAGAQPRTGAAMRTRHDAPEDTPTPMDTLACEESDLARHARNRRVASDRIQAAPRMETEPLRLRRASAPKRDVHGNTLIHPGMLQIMGLAPPEPTDP